MLVSRSRIGGLGPCPLPLPPFKVIEKQLAEAKAKAIMIGKEPVCHQRSLVQTSVTKTGFLSDFQRQYLQVNEFWRVSLICLPF